MDEEVEGSEREREKERVRERDSQQSRMALSSWPCVVTLAGEDKQHKPIAANLFNLFLG